MKKCIYEANGTKYTLYIVQHDDQKYAIMLEYWQTWMWIMKPHGPPHYTYVKEKLELGSDLDAYAVVTVIEKEIFNSKDGAEK